MSSLNLNPAQATEFRRILRGFEDALRKGVTFYAFGIAALALAAVGLLEAKKELIESYHLDTYSRMLQAILEGTASAIIIYYLIDRRLSRIRRQLNEYFMLISKTNVLSAVFDVNLDVGTVEAWRTYILEQKLSVRLARFDFFFVRQRNGISVIFELREDIVALEAIDQEKTITLGPTESEAWTITALRIQHKDQPARDVDLKESLDGPRRQEYSLKASERDEFNREIKCKRVFTGSVADNHVFANGAQRVVFRFYVDQRLHNKENLWNNPIILDLPLQENKSDWELPMMQTHENIEFNVYRCNPKCVFLPYQGFTYHFVPGVHKKSEAKSSMGASPD